MEYTVLGRTGLRVSRVGCGGGGIGQVGGPTTEAEAGRAIHRALELGVNVFDVAPGYGQGQARSEHNSKGLVIACYADGSVRNIQNSVTQDVWYYLNSRNDGVAYTYNN